MPIIIAALSSFIFSSGCTRLPEDTEQDLPILGQWQGQCYAEQRSVPSGTGSVFVDQATQTVYTFTSKGGIRKIKKTVNQYQSKLCEEVYLASTLEIEGAFTLDASVETELVQQIIDISNYDKNLIAHNEQGINILSLNEEYRSLELVIGVEQRVSFTAKDIQVYDVFLIEVSETQSVLQFGEKNGILNGQSEETRPDTLNSKVSYTRIEN